MNTACPILWLIFIMLSFAFDFNLLPPVFAVCLLWLLLNVTYCLESIRLGRRK